MRIGDIISGVSDFIDIFRGSHDSGRYSSSDWTSSTSTSKKRRPKRKKNHLLPAAKKNIPLLLKKNSLFNHFGKNQKIMT